MREDVGALRVVHGVEVAHAQIVLRQHGEASVRHQLHAAHGQRQAQGLARLAAVKAEALPDGQRFARGDAVAVGLLPGGGEPDLPRAFEEEAAAVARAGHPAQRALRVHHIEIGVVAVALFVGPAGDERRAASVRRPRQPGKEGVSGKIVQLKSRPVHGAPSAYANSDTVMIPFARGAVKFLLRFFACSRIMSAYFPTGRVVPCTTIVRLSR